MSKELKASAVQRYIDRLGRLEFFVFKCIIEEESTQDNT